MSVSLTVIAVFLALLAPPASTTQPATRHADAPPRFVLGVCTHFSQRKGIVDENLRMIRDAGVRSIRDEVPWSAVEPARGELRIPDRTDEYVNAAVALGIEPVLVLAYGNRHYQDGRKPTEPEAIEGFVRYAEFVVTHFRGRVRRFEVWNEWDIGIGTADGRAGTPEQYLALLRAAAPAIRRANPNAEIIGGVVSPTGLRTRFFSSLLLGGLLDHCDAVSVHPYSYGGRDPKDRQPEAVIERLRALREEIDRHAKGRRVPLYITEIGWPTHVGPTGVTAQTSADHLSRFALLARATPGIDGVWWYDFQDDGWDPSDNECNFGIVRPDLTPKDANSALRDVAGLLNVTDSAELLPTDFPGLRLLTLRSARDVTTFVGWTTATPVQVLLDVDTPGDALVRTIGRADIPRRFIHRDWVSQPRSPATPGLSLLLGSTPIVVQLPAAARLTWRPLTTRPATTPP